MIINNERWVRFSVGFPSSPQQQRGERCDSGVKVGGGGAEADVNPLLLFPLHAASVMSESLGETTHADKGDDGRR